MDSRPHTTHALGVRRRSWFGYIGATFVASFACESESDRIESLAEELARELPLRREETADQRKRRIQSSLQPSLDADFHLEAPWLSEETDRAFALTAATAIDQLFPLAALDLEDVEVELSASGKRALLRGDARASATQAADLHAFALSFEADLAKQGTRWLLVRLVLTDPRQPLPEARP
jgi:hypothetical protein